MYILNEKSEGMLQRKLECSVILLNRSIQSHNMSHYSINIQFMILHNGFKDLR